MIDGASAPRAGPSRRSLLREATRAPHAAAEAALEAQGFLDSRERYAAFLARNLGFHAAFEPLAEAAGAGRLLPDWPARRRAPLLRADLAWLASEGSGASIPGAGPFPLGPIPLDGPEGLLGALYVTEGATLGGAVLARRAEAALGVGPGGGADFLHGHGRRTGERWRRFVRVLETARLGDGAEVVLVTAARATFAAYLGAMRDGGATGAPPRSARQSRGC